MNYLVRVFDGVRLVAQSLQGAEDAMATVVQMQAESLQTRIYEEGGEFYPGSVECLDIVDDEKFAIAHQTFPELCNLRADIKTFDMAEIDVADDDGSFAALDHGQFIMSVPVEANIDGSDMKGTLQVLYTGSWEILDTHCADWEAVK